MSWYEYLGVDGLVDGGRIELSSGMFTLRDGILRQEELYSESQEQTKESFGFKWSKKETYESRAFCDSARTWLRERYLEGDADEAIETLMRPGARVLDIGCGSGFTASLLFGSRLNDVSYLGVDISSAIDIARDRFAEEGLSGEFIQADMMTLPFAEPVFDVIYAEGVLHHTDSTEKALKYLTQYLMPGGRFMFYVYIKKSPIREYVDDYIRNELSSMSDDRAWDELISLTKLGKVLGDMNVEVDIPEAIPLLGIPAGKIKLQELVYWHLFKVYYKPDWTIDEMAHVNYDWYRPLNCHRHTPDEIRRWCGDAGLEIERMNVQNAGITVVAVKK